VGLVAWGLTLLRAPQGSAITHVLAGTPAANGNYEYVENADYYTIDVAYPGVVSLQGAAGAKAELTIEQALADDIAQFKSDGNFANLTPEDVQIQGLGPDRKYVYGAEYKEYQSPGTVSYVFLIYEDTLGAHPNGFYRTFVFDTDGNELTLGDLFKPGAAYLPRLSDESYKQIVAELATRVGSEPDASMLDEVRIGTSPTPETLQFFYLDGDTLVLLFPPYQVAAYAAGSFEVDIPLSSLQDILK
jgi:hypothetical protein